MTKEIFEQLMNAWLDVYNPFYKSLEDVPAYWQKEAAELVKSGAIKSDGVHGFGLRHDTLKAAIINKRYVDS